MRPLRPLAASYEQQRRQRCEAQQASCVHSHPGRTQQQASRMHSSPRHAQQEAPQQRLLRQHSLEQRPVPIQLAHVQAQGCAMECGHEARERGAARERL